MKSPRSPRRWLAMAATFALVGVVLWVVASQGTSSAEKDVAAPKPGEWPLFGGTVSRNLVNLFDKNIPIDFDLENQKKVKWSAELGGKAYGGPAIAGGKIFIGTNNNSPRNKRDTKDGKAVDKGVLMCFDANTGAFLWQAVHDKLPAGRVNDWPEEGICSCPVVEGNRLYYVSNRAEVICASTDGYVAGKTQPTHPKYTDKTDAGVLWRLDMIQELNVFPHNLATCSPLIVGDTLFVITSNGVDEGHINIPRPAAPSFLAIDKNTGKLKWKDDSPSVRAVGFKGGIKELVDRGQVLMHGQWSNPVYAEPNGKPQIIFPGGDGWVRAFNPADGKLLWKFDCNPKDSKYVLGGNGTRSDFVSTPVVSENKLYLGTGQDPEHNKGVGHLWCIDIAKEPKNADKDLSPVNNNFDPKASVNKDSGLVWHYGGFAPEGKYDRKYYFGRTLSTVAVHDGLVYAGEYDGVLHCLDARTGKQYWEQSLGQDTWCSPYWVDGKVFIGNENGQILVFQHGKEKKPLATIETGASFVRATPVAANGVLYVVTENPCKLWAIK
jgi:outer membrane protein assembly factor BamB